MSFRACWPSTMPVKALIVALCLSAWITPVEMYKSYAAEETRLNVEGGQNCHDKLAEIKGRIQKLIDDYNKADEEAGTWPLTR